MHVCLTLELAQRRQEEEEEEEEGEEDAVRV